MFTGASERVGAAERAGGSAPAPGSRPTRATTAPATRSRNVDRPVVERVADAVEAAVRSLAG